MEYKMLKRNIQAELEAYLKIMPVVLITGARQTGKTTLVESVAKKQHYTYLTFDDEPTLANARRDPSGWLNAYKKPLIIDEVQRFPELFLAIKRDVDQNREPGRYLLTGSANPLLIPRLGDSLAGRMGIVNLFPFSQGELQHIKENFISYLFEQSPSANTKIEPLLNENLHHFFFKGGFPPVQLFKEMKDVSRWVRSYLQTIIERDVRDLSQVEGLREFPRLFRLLATRSGMLLNIADLSRSLGMVNMTLNRYLRLLETLYFIYLLPAWFSNHGKRLTKSPKVHICDTAILAQLLEVDESKLRNDPSLAGQFLESFVFAELLKQKSWASIPCELYHFRNGDYEVDLILERSNGDIIGIEVKSSRTLHSDDMRGLVHLKKIAGKKFKRGIILHPGSQIEPMDKDIWAMPIQSLWTNF